MAGAGPAASEGHGLRLRRRIRTKQMVQTEALRLFETKGYEQTTVDEIAHAAAMSPRTFFRYFPTKEDVVLWDAYDELPMRQVWDFAPGSDPLVQFTTGVRRIIAEIYHEYPDLLLTRIKLSFAVSEIRARFLDQQFTTLGPYFEDLARAAGASAVDQRLRVTVAAVFGAVLVAMERWQHNDGREDLMEIYDESMALLVAGIDDLRGALLPDGADGIGDGTDTVSVNTNTSGGARSGSTPPKRA